MSGRLFRLRIGAALVLILTAAGAPADPLPQGGAAQGGAAQGASDAAVPTDKAPSPPSVMEQNDVPPVAPKDVGATEGALPEPPKPSAAADAAAPKNVEPVLPSQAFSVLGKKVHGPDGKDVMGSISDILVDDQGHPRAAIIDFGGFLGVGSRKIAVDWQLMKFHPTDTGAPIVLDLDRSEIQSAPEYKDPTQPAEVVEPAVTGAAAPAAPVTVADPPTQPDTKVPANPVVPPVDTAAQPDAEKHPN
jgi:hypothetical protein